MKIYTVIAAVLIPVCLSGCEKVRTASASISLPTGCHKEGTLFAFDNMPGGDGTVGRSEISCENAKHNWYKTPAPPRDWSEVKGQTGTPDPKTGLLP